MSAPVTEAHIARARASGFSTDKGLQMAAQFIANNEAAKAERDQLRAEVAWWKNWHEENEKLEDGIAVKVQATIDGLRAEVERLKRDYDYDHKCLYEVRERCELWKQRAEGAEAALKLLREWQREVIQNENAHHAERREAIARAESAEREAFDWKKIARYETARASRAEAELATERAKVKLREAWLCGHTDGIDCGSGQRSTTDLVTFDDAEAKGHVAKYKGSWTMEGWYRAIPVRARAAIDAAMKEGTK